MNSYKLVASDILNKERLTDNEIAKVKCSVEKEFVANQPNVFANQSISPSHKATNEFLTDEPEIPEIQAETDQVIIEGITHLRIHGDT